MKNEINIDFVQWNSDGSRIELSFTENNDEMDIFLFHDLCRRFAAAAGYSENSINEAFGEVKY